MRAGDGAAVYAEKGDGFGHRRLLHNQRAHAVEALHWFGHLLQDRRELFEARVQSRGFFKGKRFRRMVAFDSDLALERFAARVEKVFHADDLSAVLVVGAALEARGEAHLHLGIDAAGEGEVGMKVVDAAAHLEEVECVVHEFFRRQPRRERAVVDVFSAEAREARYDRGSRVFVSEMQHDEWGEPQAQPVGVGFGKCGAEKPVEQESRFEVGTGERVLDGSDAFPQVETPAALFRRRKQAFQAAAQVSGLADVRLGGGSAARKRKTAGAAGTAENRSRSRSSVKSRRSLNTAPIVVRG